MFPTTIAGSLPKPPWLAEPHKLWAPWRLAADLLVEAMHDATLIAIKTQEDAGIDIITDGEQSRQHFVHGFLERVEGIDFGRRVEMGIRNNRYKAMVPTVVGALKLKSRAHPWEAPFSRAHTKRKFKFTLPGPMTIVDTVANDHYKDRADMAMAFAELLNQESRALQKDGVDVVQFDEPAVHICYGYGIQQNIDWKAGLGDEWRQYEAIFPVLAKSQIDQVAVECINSRVPMSLLKLLDGKAIQIGAIDVAVDVTETPEQVAALIAEATKYVAKDMIIASTNCGMAPMRRDVAEAKMVALAKGAALARQLYA
jgi:5-methyltetrahydropteroyltriglutamate--homocysteine methyltransferase